MGPHGDEGAGRRPAVTAVVATHDRPQFLADCLTSLSAEMAPTDQLVVAESGDSDAARVLAALPETVNWVHMTVTERAKTAKLNAALRGTSGEIVVCTDDDCRVQPGWLDGMAGAFENPTIGIAFGPVEGLDEVPSRPEQRPRIPPGPGPIENWNYAHGAAMAIRRSAIVAVGGFDERLGPGTRTHGEEADVLVRMAARGWGCAIADAPTVTHLDWRDDVERLANLLVYERGAGAWLGAGLRREPMKVAKVLLLRLRYQAGLWTDRRARGASFGPRTTVAFLGGLARGLTYRPRRWL